jgi:hypothetical protein
MGKNSEFQRFHEERTKIRRAARAEQIKKRDASQANGTHYAGD